MKKLFATLLTLAMVLALAVPAMAADPTTGTITINNAVKDQQYTIYKVFDLTYDTANTDHVSYTYTKSESGSDSLFDTLNGESSPFKMTQIGSSNKYQVTLKNKPGTDPATPYTGEDIAAFLTTNKANLTQAGTTATPTLSGDKYSVQFTNLTFGYYYIESTVGAVAMVNSTTPDITIESKNSAPTLTQSVQTAGDADWVTSDAAHNNQANTAAYGDTLNFKLEILAGAGAQNYVVHDTLDSGLKFGGTVTVTLEKYTTPVSESDTDYGTAENLTADNQYTLDTTDIGAETFQVIFKEEFLKTLGEKDRITITYSATVNNGQDSNTPAAVIREPGNKNTAHISYGAATPAEKVEITTITMVYDFYIFKHFVTPAEGSGDDTKTALAGAKFILSKGSGDNIKYAKITNTAGTTSNGTLIEWVATQSEATTLVSQDTALDGATGNIRVAGLDAGEYILKEIEAPAPYNLLDKDLEIQITETGIVELKGESGYAPVADSLTVPVENQAGQRLPSTGGIGTTIFYIVGSVLVLGAVILLITKKKMSKYDEEK